MKMIFTVLIMPIEHDRYKSCKIKHIAMTKKEKTPENNSSVMKTHRGDWHKCFIKAVSLRQKNALKALIDKKVIEFLIFQYFQIKMS